VQCAKETVFTVTKTFYVIWSEHKGWFDYRLVGSELFWSSGGGVPPWRHKPNCRMSTKTCPIFIVYLLYKYGQDLWTNSNCATHGNCAIWQKAEFRLFPFCIKFQNWGSQRTYCCQIPNFNWRLKVIVKTTRQRFRLLER